jgi:hypothetical protein
MQKCYSLPGNIVKYRAHLVASSYRIDIMELAPLGEGVGRDISAAS